jgi:hypothetical protein
MNKKIITLLLSLLITGCWETEKGEKVGIIVKLGKQGAFIKTNEAELIRGGMNNGNGSFGVRPFDFTIEDERLLRIVQKAFDEQKEIKITYHKEWATLWRTETSDNSFLDDVEIIEEGK